MVSKRLLGNLASRGDFMNAKSFLTLLLFGMAQVSHAAAETTTPDAQLQRFATEAKRAGVVELGQQFFVKKHGHEWSCASCHGESPTSPGRHATTAKVLEPLAPAFNPRSLTDSARVDKWFRRNCKDVLGRECTAGEKADVLAWLSSLK